MWYSELNPLSCGSGCGRSSSSLPVPFLHHRRKAYRRGSQRKGKFFYNCKSEHKDTTSQYVAKPLRMLGLHTNSKSEISSLPMDLLWRSETQKSKHTAFKTDRWMWWYGTWNSGQEPWPWPTWSVGVDTFSWTLVMVSGPLDPNNRGRVHTHTHTHTQWVFGQ